MAKDFIRIDTTALGATQSGLLRQYIQTLRNAYNLGTQVRGIMQHNNDGADFTPIEVLFGLSGSSGQIVFDLVNGSVGAMEGQFQVADAKTITEKVGQG